MSEANRPAKEIFNFNNFNNSCTDSVSPHEPAEPDAMLKQETEPVLRYVPLKWLQKLSKLKNSTYDLTSNDIKQNSVWIFVPKKNPQMVDRALSDQFLKAFI